MIRFFTSTAAEHASRTGNPYVNMLVMTLGVLGPRRGISLVRLPCVYLQRGWLGRESLKKDVGGGPFLYALHRSVETVDAINAKRYTTGTGRHRKTGDRQEEGT